MIVEQKMLLLQYYYNSSMQKNRSNALKSTILFHMTELNFSTFSFLVPFFQFSLNIVCTKRAEMNWSVRALQSLLCMFNCG